MYNFYSFDDFKEAIKEIQVLVENANNFQNDILKYGTFNKASIVLLCGKFESFIESFLEEYCYEITSNYTNDKLEENIKHHLTDVLITELEKKKNNKNKRIEIITKFNMLYGSEEILCHDYTIDCKFSYGKHGEGEVKKLLKKFGFEDFVELEENKEFYKNFNSLNHLRNNILHEDSTPTLTHNDVEIHIELILNFITTLCKNASIKLEYIEEIYR
ncbi:HEPN domain-containing protein [Empedobacter brevis]|uniref:HEPN domain-containing protein n=1 Tax=Empedobacter brevis TaxID=247 RepID=UPI00333FD9F4